jgi:protein arginine kinase activator
MDNDLEEHQNKRLERPLECSECKKEIAVRYTEIEKGQLIETGMCQDCPVLQRKLFGHSSYPYIEESERGSTPLACGNCGTTLEQFRVGHPLGCSHCYDVFGEGVVFELKSLGKLPQTLAENRSAKHLHQGKGPGEVSSYSPSMQLIALHETLDEMLKKEDYEQAALIRDRIREIEKQVKKR